MDSPTPRACSKCRSSDDLHLVTLGEPGGGQPGRALLYCARCRAQPGHRIDISWPLGLLTPGTFLELYRMGKTVSDPRMAVHLVFGQGNDWIATEAADLLERRRLGE